MDVSGELVRYDGHINGMTQGWQFLESEAGAKVYVPFEGIYESKGILMSPPHSVDWRPYDTNNVAAELPVMTWTEETLDQRKTPLLLWSPYAATAKACGVAFWNMTAPTADYVAQSRKPHDFFNRDFIHNNDRGKQIIGRVMQRYFQTAR